MERLTDKYGTTSCDNIARVLKNGTTDKFVIGGKAIVRLKEFEDLMKKYNVEDLEHLDIMLFVLSGETKYRLKEIQQENQTLKGNWAKLREWVWDKEPLFKGANAIFKKSEVLGKMQELESVDGEL